MLEFGKMSGFTLLIGAFIRQSINAKRSRRPSIMLLLASVSPVVYADQETPTSFWLSIESYLVVMAVCIFIPLRYKLRSHRVSPKAKLNNELTMRQIAVLADPDCSTSRLLDVEILEALQTDVLRFCSDTNTLVPGSTPPNADQQDLVAALAHNGRLPRPWNSGYPPNHIKNKSSQLRRELSQLGLHYSDLRVFLVFGIIFYIGLFGTFYGWMIFCKYDPDYFTQAKKAAIIISMVGQFIILLSVGNRRYGFIRYRTGAGDLLLEELKRRVREVDEKSDLNLQFKMALCGTYAVKNTPFNQYKDALHREEEMMRQYV